MWAHRVATLARDRGEADTICLRFSSAALRQGPEEAPDRYYERVRTAARLIQELRPSNWQDFHQETFRRFLQGLTSQQSAFLRNQFRGAELVDYQEGIVGRVLSELHRDFAGRHPVKPGSQAASSKESLDRNHGRRGLKRRDPSQDRAVRRFEHRDSRRTDQDRHPDGGRLKCTFCHISGHTEDNCYKKHPNLKPSNTSSSAKPGGLKQARVVSRGRGGGTDVRSDRRSDSRRLSDRDSGHIGAVSKVPGGTFQSQPPPLHSPPLGWGDYA